MTRIAYASDLHLEFFNMEILNPDNADVLILAGDVCVARDFQYLHLDNTRKQILAKQESAMGYHEFFASASKNFKKVIYVMGNHEHYNGDIEVTRRVLEDELKIYPNIQLIEDEFVELDDVVIVGGTLWTNLFNNDPVVIEQLRNMFTDFTEIKDSSTGIQYRVPDGKGGMQTKRKPGRHTPERAIKSFDHTLAYINFVDRLFKDKKPVVVVTHHAPSARSSLPQYRGNIINPGFYSDLDETILDLVSTTHWIHGHMHNNSDYMIGDVNVLCNPRGYIRTQMASMNYKVKYIDI